MLNALGYVWRIGLNLLYLLVIWYVFTQLHGHTEAILVPILGLLYVTTRTTAMATGTAAVHLGVVLDEINERLKRLADPTYVRDRDEAEEIKKLLRHAQPKQLIEYLFLGLVSLLCLWELFTQVI